MTHVLMLPHHVWFSTIRSVLMCFLMAFNHDPYCKVIFLDYLMLLLLHQKKNQTVWLKKYSVNWFSLFRSFLDHVRKVIYIYTRHKEMTLRSVYTEKLQSQTDNSKSLVFVGKPRHSWCPGVVPCSRSVREGSSGPKTSFWKLRAVSQQRQSVFNSCILFYQA